MADAVALCEIDARGVATLTLNRPDVNNAYNAELVAALIETSADLASSEAGFAISQARWGVFASVIIPQLNATIGGRQVRRYAITCERFGAERALQSRNGPEVCKPGALDETAAPPIDGILRASPLAVSAT